MEGACAEIPDERTDLLVFKVQPLSEPSRDYASEFLKGSFGFRVQSDED